MQWSTLQQLQQQLQSANAGTRRQAAEQLGQSKDERAVEALIVALTGGERDMLVLLTVGEALAQIADARAVPALMEVLQHHEYAVVRGAAAYILGAIGDARAVEPLVRALQDDEGVGGGIRANIAGALGKIGDARAVEALIAHLERGDKWEVLCEVAEALGKIGDARAVVPLVSALNHWEGVVQRQAAWALGDIGDARAVEPLVSALQEAKDDFVPAAAARALGDIGDARAVVPLVSALQETTHDSVRQEAAWALGKLGDARTVEPLVRALKEATSSAQHTAATALGIAGDIETAESLLEAHHQWQVHEAARRVPTIPPSMMLFRSLCNSILRGCSKLSPGLASRLLCCVPLHKILYGVPSIERFFEENVEESPNRMQERVFRQFERILKSILTLKRSISTFFVRSSKKPTSERTIPLRGIGGEGEDDVERSAAGIPPREEIGDVQAVLPLVWALNDVEDVVRSAAWALGQLGDARAVDVLIADLARNEKSEALRGAVAEALSRIGDARAVALAGALEEDAGLRRRMRSEGFHGPAVALVGALEENAEQEALRVETVAEALGRIGDARAIEPLVSVLQDKDGRVRQAAAEALTTLGWQLREDTSPPPEAGGMQ